MGLSAAAEQFLRDSVKTTPVRTCDKCGHTSGGAYTSRVYASAADEGMFNDGPELYEYECQDGRIVREVVQAVPWSSGPCIFLCLVDQLGNKIFPWSEEDLNNC